MKDSPGHQKRYSDLGADYYWFAGHYDVAEHLLRRQLRRRGRKARSLLDVGCGPGNLLARFREVEVKLGSDFSLDAIGHARRAVDAGFFTGDLCRLPLRDNSVDCVAALEVIEHIEDDARAMAEIHRVLVPGGVAVISVPAFMFLWGSHDEWNDHKRRYTLRELCRRLETTGLRVAMSGYFKSMFLLPLIFTRLFKNLVRAKTDDFYAFPAWANWLLRKQISLEGKMLAGLNKVAGVSIIAVVEKATEA